MLKKYMIFIAILIGISIVLGMSYSNFIVASENHKVAEMYIGTLKYSMSIDGTNTNTLSVPSGETIIDVTITNENPIDTYYKLIYENNSNVTIKYYESTKDTEDNVTNYSSPNDKITSMSTNTIKLKITNNNTSSQDITFKIVGGFATNTLNDVTVSTEYTIIDTAEVQTSNTYFCTSNDEIADDFTYTNLQYTYSYINNELKVKLTDKTNDTPTTSNVCTYINNKPITSAGGMFNNSNTTSIDLNGFNTSNITDMLAMFRNCAATTITGLSNFDTSKVTDMSEMFRESLATSLDLSSFNTSNVTNMNFMFAGSQAETLELSNFNITSVKYLSYMFSTTKASIIDLSGFDTSNITNMFNMFSNSEVKTIYVSNFDTSNVTGSVKMFYGCTNLVGGAGTTYNSSYIDKTYAHIDGGTSNPGYFTDVADKPSTFPTDSWETIAASVKAGNTRGYKVGETKEIDMGTYGTHTLRIANTSTPSECSTAGFSQSACGFVVEFTDIITTHKMNPAGEYNGTQYNFGHNIGGWPASSMYTFANNDIYNTLPSDLRNVIIDTLIVSSHGNGDTENFTSTDKLYLLDPKEIYIDFSDSNDTAKDLTRTLDYYTTKGVTINKYNGAIKKNGTNIDEWWLRSAFSIGNTYYYTIGMYTACETKFASTEVGVSPAFRIG